MSSPWTSTTNLCDRRYDVNDVESRVLHKHLDRVRAGVYRNTKTQFVTRESMMSSLSRFSVSLDQNLLRRFDAQIEAQGYPTRSKAIGDLMRRSLVEEEWRAGKEVAAAIVLVYDHHKRELSNRLTGIQHEHYRLIISTQHVHLDHDNCLEIVVVRGKPGDVEKLAHRLRAAKGVKYASLAAASTGRNL